MDHRSKYSYWDRDELLETVKETHQQLHGKLPKPGLYDELEIKGGILLDWSQVKPASDLIRSIFAISLQQQRCND